MLVCDYAESLEMKRSRRFSRILELELRILTPTFILYEGNVVH